MRRHAPRAGAGAAEEFIWRVDLGPDVTLEHVTTVLGDLDAAIQLGERLAWLSERQALYTSNLSSAAQEGPDFLRTRASELGVALPEEEKLLHYWPWGYVHEQMGFTSLLDKVVDSEMTAPPVPSTVIVGMRFSNPLEVVLSALANRVPYIVRILQVIRDWNPERRASAAEATIAESHARMVSAQADLFEYLCRKAMEDPETVAASRLFESATQRELSSVIALSELVTELADAAEVLAGPSPNEDDR
ncbi:hypothetical protein [Actinoplanes siamensis]|uniref:Uncharacterized protein n=1 Tax=Actinoplanes siamensis TaxID=1223317 RepID=A0A919NDA2_9ACTN|nr:hypothetical protein [Actinoplanes siamensis]GIF09117.1 hypothetical protein Asi03nite_66550 [Actinoplanes siamensis]